MGILNIRPAVRGGSKPIIGICGTSGSGKTYTALKMARGMVNKPSEIGFIDTENKRGSLYADILDGTFQIGDLYAPFSPSRYSEAIKEFQAAGVKVLVLDSVSHEWEGEGGCDDIANAPKADGTPRKVPNWIGAKRQHKTFMNTLLYCPMPVIACIRARDKIKVVKINGKEEFIPQGLQPICEKSFMFEMTASMLIEEEGKKQTFLKMPDFLKPFFGNGNGYLGEETGRKVIEWFEVGERDSPEVVIAKANMLSACELGLAGLMAIWNTLTPAMKKKLEAHKNLCKASAIEYDRQAKEADETPQETLERNQSANGTQKVELP